MTLEEFSNGFDVLINSYRRFKDFDSQEILDSIEFNEYEKSFFLSKAQDELVLSYYTGRNPIGESFESNEEMRRHLNNLVCEAELSPEPELGANEKSKFFDLPENLWFIIFELVTVHSEECGDDALDVYPVKHDEFIKLRNNPFRGPNNRRVLRLDISDNRVEIVSKHNILKYYIRYIRKLNPIILEDLPDGVSIDNESGARDCELHEKLHQKVLDLAVAMALQSKGISLSQDSKKDK